MLSQDLARYIDQQRSLGFKFRLQHILLRGFVAFAEEGGDRYIRSDRVLTWAACAPSPEQRRSRLLTARRFALALRAENGRHQVPAADALGHAVAKRRTPYIYPSDEIARLLRAAANLQPAGSVRPVMYTTLLGLLTATGMRIAEALALRLDDMTPDGLVIRQTKFQKSRLLPLHPTTKGALDAYLVARRPLVTENDALFCFTTPCAVSSFSFSIVPGSKAHIQGETRASTIFVTPSRFARWSSAAMIARRSLAISWRSVPTSATCMLPIPTGTCRRHRR
jgi:integrase